MTDSTHLGQFMEQELASQPEMWARAEGLRDEQAKLPAKGARIAVVGCGTSWFMAQAYATLRERAGFGITDAFTATETELDRNYDAIVALTRSGTTSEVLELVEKVKGKTPVISVLGDPESPLVSMSDEVIALPFADEKSVVQTRFATTALALFRASLGEDLSTAIAQAADVIAEDLDPELVAAEQYSYLGTGWTIGLATEAALKMREAAQAWTESYPAMEYRHGPISIAAPGRVTWAFGEVPVGLAEQVAAAGARFEHRQIDGMADLVRGHRVALAKARLQGLNPDQPRNLTRSVILEP